MSDSIFDYVSIYENVLDDKTLSTFIKICETTESFEDAPVVYADSIQRVAKSVRQTKSWPLENNLKMKSFTTIHWCNYLLHVFSQNIKKYFSKFEGNISVNLKEIQVLKYNEGGHYEFHVDHGTHTPRTLSLIFLVNDGYEGGDLIFANPERNKQIKVPPKKNTLLIWPSNFLYPHTVTPVTKGVRYSVVAWAL